MTQRVQIADLPALQEYEIIIDSPLFSLLPESCTTTEATSINPQEHRLFLDEQFFAPGQAYRM
ncbi:2329_t:CDS:2 [Paraglomus brasilianum]|uniref:2329_t:CDS:1 n=1 Tax=Paraglomus brasilianum TaxID=144538 RepID=A0A9N9FLJ1_9GLOM|nr:2329_t:CDS:2 [Paraglomus brasilianum]